MAINNQPTIKPRYVTGIFTKYIAKTLPLAFDESMSYYECLCALLEYINTQVMPALDNNATGLEELQQFYLDLQNYVNNYFNNLDVQDEINNKLDEMAESGQLTDIIAQYLGLAGMITFNTVEDMKNATNLVNGSKCYTLGFYNYNDGGGAVYKIRNVTNEDVINNIDLFPLQNTSLVAELIINNDIYIKQLGAKGNNEDDDTEIINYALNKYSNLIFNKGNYFISDELISNIENQKITFNNARITLNSSFKGNNVFTIKNNYTELINLYIINGKTGVNGINIEGFNTKIDTATVTGIGFNALFINGAEARIYNSKFRSHSYGITIEKPDSFFENVYTEQNTYVGFRANGVGSIEAIHVHSYNNGTHGFYLTGASYSNFYGCYADTNGSNGFEVRDSQAGMNFIGCWGYKSNRTNVGYNWFLYNVSNVLLEGCYSSQNSSSGSYRVNASSNVILSSCRADDNPTFDTKPTCINCFGILSKYNVDTINEKYSGSGTINANSNVSVNIDFPLPSITAPGIRSFELYYTLRNTSGSTNYTRLGKIMFTVGDSAYLTNINYLGDTNPYITLSSISYSNDTLSFTLNNTLDENVQCGLKVKFIGTSRGIG